MRVGHNICNYLKVCTLEFYMLLSLYRRCSKKVNLQVSLIYSFYKYRSAQRFKTAWTMNVGLNYQGKLSSTKNWEYFQHSTSKADKGNYPTYLWNVIQSMYTALSSISNVAIIIKYKTSLFFPGEMVGNLTTHEMGRNFSHKTSTDSQHLELGPRWSYY